MRVETVAAVVHLFRANAESDSLPGSWVRAWTFGASDQSPNVGPNDLLRLSVMTPERTPPVSSGASGKSVQDYIDETPVWADATPVRYAPMTNMQWLIWGLAAAGKFFEGAVVFMTGVALLLMGQEFGLGATEKGVIAAASLFGILIGATALGGLADRYGRKQMFIIEMLLFGIFVTLLTFSPSYIVVVVALVGIGIALGCDYPTAHLIISGSTPSRIRGRMVLGAFGFQAVGAWPVPPSAS
jgi:putative MFS transporter